MDDKSLKPPGILRLDGGLTYRFFHSRTVAIDTWVYPSGTVSIPINLEELSELVVKSPLTYCAGRSDKSSQHRNVENPCSGRFDFTIRQSPKPLKATPDRWP